MPSFKIPTLLAL